MYNLLSLPLDLSNGKEIKTSQIDKKKNPANNSGVYSHVSGLFYKQYYRNNNISLYLGNVQRSSLTRCSSLSTW